VTGVQTCALPIWLANLAAGVVVGQVGTVPIQKMELLAALEQGASRDQVGKIRTPEGLMPLLQAWRGRGERIVFTNGCFDILHVGHVTYLEQARRLGDRLIVGLNTDASVRALKGPSRPVLREQDRARLLAALQAVDAVVLFEAETPLRLIELFRPDVLAKGGDYREDQVVGAPQVRAWGGEVALLPIVPGISTSTIVESLARR
jgi:D-beta-D-heptose 7-phosphate kinase/D-beta-D-heptose 1-phosphate adenosyltransferase